MRSAHRATEESPVSPEHGLSLVYQPVVSASTGRVIAVEALLRSQNDQGHVEFPARLLQQSARSGTTLDFDATVLGMVCSDIKQWQGHEAGDLPRVHVNIAPESLASPDLAQRLIAVVEAAGVAPSALCLELSEYCGYDDLVQASEQLRTLTHAGFDLALDDMGVTLAALRLIGDVIPVTCIKVDRSIVAGSGKGVAFDAAVLEMIAKLGLRHGIDVVAEGVESEAESAVVEMAGIDAVQGYLYSRPLEKAQLATLMHAAIAHR